MKFFIILLILLSYVCNGNNTHHHNHNHKHQQMIEDLCTEWHRSQYYALESKHSGKALKRRVNMIFKTNDEICNKGGFFQHLKHLDVDIDLAPKQDLKEILFNKLDDRFKHNNLHHLDF